MKNLACSCCLLACLHSLGAVAQTYYANTVDGPLTDRLQSAEMDVISAEACDAAYDFQVDGNTTWCAQRAGVGPCTVC